MEHSLGLSLLSHTPALPVKGISSRVVYVPALEASDSTSIPLVISLSGPHRCWRERRTISWSFSNGIRQVGEDTTGQDRAVGVWSRISCRDLNRSNEACRVEFTTSKQKRNHSPCPWTNRDNSTKSSTRDMADSKEKAPDGQSSGGQAAKGEQGACNFVNGGTAGSP
jgi:hypothetical protein